MNMLGKSRLKTMILGSEKERSDQDKKNGKSFNLKRLPVFITIDDTTLSTNDSRMITNTPPDRQEPKATKPKTLQAGGVL